MNYYIGLTMLTLALIEGFAGYSLVDDLLSGMGLAIGYGAALDPVDRRRLRRSWSGTASSRARTTSSPACTSPTCCSSRSIIGGLIAVHLPLITLPHHTQFRGPGRTERNVIGHTDVARATRSARDRPAVRDRRRPLPARRDDPDQPDLALGSVRVPRDERRAARLVHGLADRGAAADAADRAGDRRATRSFPNPFFGGCCCPGWSSASSTVAHARAPGDRRRRGPQPARPPARQPRGGPAFGAACSPS